MAIVVSELWPADTEAHVVAAERPRFRITDDTAADLDLTLIELILDGTSYTYAAGQLFIYGTKDTSYADDTSDVLVELETGVTWWPGESAEVAFGIEYNTASVSATTYTTAHTGGPTAGGSVPGNAALASVSGLVTLQLPFNFGAIAGGPVFGSRSRVHYPVEGLVRAVYYPHYDAYGYVARLVTQSILGSVIVADPDWQTILGSLVVQGDRLQLAHGSAVVQGPVRQTTLGSLVVGVQYITYVGASAVVAGETLSVVHGSAVVRGVYRGSVLEVEVLDPTTVAALAAMGVTFG